MSKLSFHIDPARLRKAERARATSATLSVLAELRRSGDESAALGDYRTAFYEWGRLRRFEAGLRQQLSPHVSLVEREDGAFCIRTAAPFEVYASP